MAVWRKIIAAIEDHRTFIITSHLKPDCDALGCELALAEHLRHLGKAVTIINSDPTPQAYQFLDPAGMVETYDPAHHAAVIAQAEAIIVVDAAGTWERMGEVGRVLGQTQKLTLCIDHHDDPSNFAHEAVVNPAAAANGEQIYDLIRAMHGQISPTMAQALYAALMTDTGRFRFPKTRPVTYQIAAELLAAGANPAYIYRQIYEQSSLGRLRLKGRVMDSVQLAAAGQLAYYGVNRAMLAEYGVRPEELNGFTNLAQEVAGVRVVLFGVDEGHGKVKISLRSDGSVAINQLARDYGGGGHPSAAGATIAGRLDAVIEEVVAKVKQLLA
jgi:phosphoesterase RecJ-like protein